MVHSPSAAIKPESPLVHENMHIYKHDETVYPEPGTNVQLTELKYEKAIWKKAGVKVS